MNKAQTNTDTNTNTHTSIHTYIYIFAQPERIIIYLFINILLSYFFDNGSLACIAESHSHSDIIYSYVLFFFFVLLRILFFKKLLNVVYVKAIYEE